jgi:peptidoglycan/LPS O-acetylase OafA/YrhL
LRGVAVLAVLLFHGGFAQFGGGFVGVDVFFVISGYLIASIVLAEIRRGTFSIGRFYERRIRRIFPALFLTLGLTVVAAAVLFEPTNFKQVAESTIAVSLFVSNVLFWRQAGYFDSGADQKPLLHTWSLSVEEQFYLLFPLALLLIRRYGRSRFPLWLGLGALASLALSVVATRHSPVAAFYLAPTRACELLLGAILACGALPAARSAAVRNVSGLAGLALIAASVIGYDSNTPFPGLAAAAPTLGAALLIYAGTGGSSPANRFLAASPLVFVGKISYSLYLLHWPLLVFARDYSILELSTATTLGLLITSVGLAALSWMFVEQPFRTMSLSRPRLFGVSGALTAASVAVGVFIMMGNGLPDRFGRGSSGEVADAADSQDVNACAERRPEEERGLCRLGGQANPTFLLWGDSHASALSAALSKAAGDNDLAGYLAFKPGCPPLLGVETRWPLEQESSSCVAYNNLVLDYVVRRPELRTIFLASRWGMFASGRSYKSEKNNSVILSASWQPTSGHDNATLFAAGFETTLRTIRELGRTIVLVGPIPEVGYDVPEALFVAARTGRNVNEIIGPTRREYEERDRPVLEKFKALSGTDGIEVVDVEAWMCEEHCKVADAGRALYRDDNHLSTYGSQYLSPLFDKVLAHPELVAGRTEPAGEPGEEDAKVATHARAEAPTPRPLDLRAGHAKRHQPRAPHTP